MRLPRILVILALLAVSACENSSSKLKAIVEEANKNYPAMLDSETRIENIEVTSENTLRYNYTLVNGSRQNIDTFQFRRAMWPGIVSMIKLSPDMRKLRESETVIEYSYRDKQNIPVYTFTILPEHYK